MPKKEAEGINGRLLYGRDNLVVAMPDVTGEKARCYVFQVLPGAWQPLRWRPLPLRDSAGATVTIASGNGEDYQRLFDAAGDDILRIPKKDVNKYRVYHFSLAVQQDRTRVYPRIPSTQRGGAFTYLDASEPDPTTGDPFGYILGSEMNFYNPPRELETIAFMAGDTSVIQYGFYNEHPDHRIIPRMQVKGRSYLLKPYTKEQDRLKVISGKIPRTMVDWGPLRGFEPPVPDAWDNAMTIIEEASLISKLLKEAR